MSDLFTATRPNDLPPRWDGNPVEWSEWRLVTGFVCPPQRETCCPRCGCTRAQPSNRGTYREGAVRGTAVDIRHRAGSLRGLVAFRCPDCRHDQVLDMSGRWWDLEPDDYLDEGSYA